MAACRSSEHLVCRDFAIVCNRFRVVAALTNNIPTFARVISQPRFIVVDEVGRRNVSQTHSEFREVCLNCSLIDSCPFAAVCNHPLRQPIPLDESTDPHVSRQIVLPALAGCPHPVDCPTSPSLARGAGVIHGPGTVRCSYRR